MKRLFTFLKRWYYDLPINLKLNLTNLFIIIFPMVLLAFLTNKVSSEIIISQSIRSSVQSLNVVTRSINGLLNQTEYLSKLIASNNSVQQMLQVSEFNIATMLEKRIGVVSSLDSIVGDRDIISSAIIFTNKGLIFNSSGVATSKLPINDQELNVHLKAAMERKGEVLWRDTLPGRYFLWKEKVDCVSLFRALIDGSTGEIKGAIQVDIDQNTVAALFSNPDTDNLDATLIMDQKGDIVSSSRQNQLYDNISRKKYYRWITNHPNQGKVFPIGKEKYLITSVKYERLGWYIVGFIPLKNLTKDSEKVTNLIFLIGLLCISLAVIASILNSRAITKPIIRLAQDMANAGQGDMEVRSVAVGNDEVGNLSKSFNAMIERISNLMDKVYLEQRKKREHELLALQSQINPHFLYNTLESVCSLANRHRNEEVVSMVKSLAMFYRSVLSKGRNVITIREEIDNIRHYLMIQQIRYGEKFVYEIDIDQNILDKPIVKLSLQPLVENAIYHGIRQKPDQGVIRILGTAGGQIIKITVVDDGVGFDDHELKRIFSETDVKPAPKTEGKSYGLKNVNERIKLYFGPEYGLHIASSPGKGTRVEVILPATTYDA